MQWNVLLHRLIGCERVCAARDETDVLKLRICLRDTYGENNSVKKKQAFWYFLQKKSILYSFRFWDCTHHFSLYKILLRNYFLFFSLATRVVAKILRKILIRDKTLLLSVVALRCKTYHETEQTSQVMKIERTCPSQFFTIFQKLRPSREWDWECSMMGSAA